MRNFQRIFASHPDHLAAGEATICAVYPDSRNPFTCPELLEEGHQPWTVDELWLMSGPDADTFVDITEMIDRKIAALVCHASQITDPDGHVLRFGADLRAGEPMGDWLDGSGRRWLPVPGGGWRSAE